MSRLLVQDKVRRTQLILLQFCQGAKPPVEQINNSRQEHDYQAHRSGQGDERGRSFAVLARTDYGAQDLSTIPRTKIREKGIQKLTNKDYG